MGHMYQAEKRHKHGPPCAGHDAHAPDGERADQSVNDDPAQRIAPSSAERGEQADERDQSKLEIQVRRKHGAQYAEQDEA